MEDDTETSDAPCTFRRKRVLRKKKTDTGNIDTKRKKKLDTNVNRAETKYAEPDMLQVTSAVVKETDLRIDSDIDVATDRLGDDEQVFHVSSVTEESSHESWWEVTDFQSSTDSDSDW